MSVTSPLSENSVGNKRLSSKRRREILSLLIGIMVLAMAFRIASLGQNQRYEDFDTYYYGALVERTGSYTEVDRAVNLAKAANRSVSHEGAYGSPALVALLFVPMSFLPLDAAHAIWDITVLSLILVISRRVGGRNWLLLLCALALCRSMSLGMQLANAGLLTFVLVAWSFASIRDRKHTTAGIALGTAIAMKLYPGFLIVPLIATRRWKTAGVALLVALGETLLAVPILTYDDAIKAYSALVRLGGYVHPHIENVSLAGAARHLGVDQSDAKIFSIVLTLCSWALIVALRSPKPERTFALAACLMVAAGSLTWPVYLLVTLLYIFAIQEETFQTKTWVGICTLLCVGSLPLVMAFLTLLPNARPPWLQIVGLVMLCATAIGVEERDRRRRRQISAA